MTNSFMGRIPVPILLGITMFFWGAAFNATDVAFDYAPAGIITFMRAGIATVLLLALMPILGGKFPRSRTIWLFALVVGAGSTTLSLAGLGLLAHLWRLPVDSSQQAHLVSLLPITIQG